MLTELQKVINKGAILYLEGKLATPQEIMANCVNENNLYMPDYVIDNDGSLQEVRYDKIWEE